MAKRARCTLAPSSHVYTAHKDYLLSCLCNDILLSEKIDLQVLDYLDFYQIHAVG